MTAVRSYPHDLIDEAVSWCRRNADREPVPVLCAGLALVRGLNEHQIRWARLEAVEPAAEISFPLAKREHEMADAETRTIRLDAPEWLATAMQSLIEQKQRHVGQRLLPSSSPLDLPAPVSVVRRAVARASIAATGHRLTCAGLNRSRIALAREHGFDLVAFGTGYAPSWSVRLAAAPTRHQLPPRAR